MPQPAVPTKTPLGHDELRHRTQGLGQRFRTVLLLVDGQRSLAQILSMAHQAGAQTSHFERPVQLGMVELPRDAAPEAVAEPTGPAGPSPPVVVPAPAGARPAPKLPPETLPAEPCRRPDDEPAAARAEAPARFAPVAEPIPTSRSPAMPHDAWTRQAERCQLGGSAAIESAAAWSAADAPVDAGPRPEPTPAAPPALPGPVPTALPPVPQFDLLSGARRRPSPNVRSGDEVALAEVRRLLLDVLRRDTLLTRAFAPARVRGARTQADLIDLVWEIERERAHRRRRRAQLLNLQRAVNCSAWATRWSRVTASRRRRPSSISRSPGRRTGPTPIRW